MEEVSVSEGKTGDGDLLLKNEECDSLHSLVWEGSVLVLSDSLGIFSSLILLELRTPSCFNLVWTRSRI